MRRRSVLLSVVAVVLLALVAAGRLPGAAAQDATPPAGEFLDLPEGVAFELLGLGVAEELPAAPADFVLVRFTLDPGASFPIEEADPSVALVYVEAGAFTVRVEAPMTIIRAAFIAAIATPGAVEEGAVPPPEEVAAGVEFTLAAGDSAVFPPNVAGEARNDGAEPAVALLAFVGPPEDGEATPAA